MSRSMVLLLLSLAVVAAAPTRADMQQTAPAATPSAATPAAALQAWVDAFNSRDPKRIVARYAPAAMLWGTTATTLATTPDQVWAYFKDAGARPATRVSIDSTHAQTFDANMAVLSGAYTFADVVGGVTSNVRPARYTIVFRKVGDSWLIVSHHSSRVPQP